MKIGISRDIGTQQHGKNSLASRKLRVSEKKGAAAACANVRQQVRGLRLCGALSACSRHISARQHGHAGKYRRGRRISALCLFAWHSTSRRGNRSP